MARMKTSLVLDEGTIPLARDRAQAAGMDVSHWVEQAIRNEAARSDVDRLTEWEQSLPDEDREILAAFADLDRADDLAT